MRRSEYYQKIDLYLDNELTGAELDEFNVEMLIHSGLTEEVEFHREVQEAVQEKEVMELRATLGHIMGEPSFGEDLVQEVVSEYMDYNFGLSNEFSSLREFFGPLGRNEINRLSHSLPRIHIFQHEIAAKENIHQFYKEQFQGAESEEDLLSPADEAIVAEIRNALQENDITELRANLAQIAQGIPEHRRSEEDIEKYLSHEMEPFEMADFEEELAFNQRLEADIQFHREVEAALMETGIMELRASLDKIQGIEHSVAGRAEDIERYLHDELEQEELSVFEEELTENPLLAAEVAMYKEVDIALEEKEIISLRSALEAIGKETRKNNQQAIRMPKSRVAVASIAASLILLLSIGGLLTKQTISENDLYTEYYQPYQGAGIVRSGNATMDQALTVALQKYNAREYESALKLFQEVIANDEGNPVGHFFSGVSYQETGRFSKAIEEYKIVVKDRDNLFVDQAEWYIGLCYLQSQDRKKAYRQLDKIAKSNSYYSRKAEAIIRKLKPVE
ncbi:MAG: hypothetical protein RBS73_18130 [Prolixibacteraceae bacterium]|jgi:hypothetical protein|nr:hypothetical protein [Prolixibacteraceae bacterium]